VGQSWCFVKGEGVHFIVAQIGVKTNLKANAKLHLMAILRIKVHQMINPKPPLQISVHLHVLIGRMGLLEELVGNPNMPALVLRFVQ
jgi:hypothetical protein